MAKKVGNQINWSFVVKTSNEVEVVDTDNKEGIKKVADMLHLIGAKEVEEIVFKDSNEKVVGNFTHMNLFKDGVAEADTIKHIKQQMKLNDAIAIVQIIA